MKIECSIILFLIIPVVFAECQENQIDINTASIEKLDELYGIGPVKAEAIINTRPFNSIDNLINVYGIGEATLNKIKEQGLACVEEEKDLNSKEEINEKPEEINEENSKIPIKNIEPIDEQKTFEIIKLNAQTIKREENKEVLNKNNLIMYGFFVFCVLLGILFLLNKKNDFR